MSLWHDDLAGTQDTRRLGIESRASISGTSSTQRRQSALPRAINEDGFFYRALRPQDSQDIICNTLPQSSSPHHNYPPTTPLPPYTNLLPYRRPKAPPVFEAGAVHRTPPKTSVNDAASPAHTLVNCLGRTSSRKSSSNPNAFSPDTIKDSSPDPAHRTFAYIEMAASPRVVLHKTSQFEGLSRQNSQRHIPSEQMEPAPAPIRPSRGKKKGRRFWLIMGTLMVVMFLSAIDLTIISTALPTIVRELPGSEISGTWVTSAFLLTVTAFQPLMGGLADVMGRRNSLLLSIAFFLGGSVICALADNMLVLVVGRGVQGVGGGGIQAIVEIIISDITTLRERGLYMGGMGLVFAISSLVAPILGGVFSRYDWRWIFLINLPIGGLASIFCIPFLKLNTTSMKLKDQIHRMDLFGNMVLLGSVIAILIAVTEGGVEHPWHDHRIWIPLTAGLVGLIAFFLIEFIPNPLAKDPILPQRLFAHPTAAVSFFLTFVHGIIFYGAVYILPVYFQAIKDASPLQSAFDILPSTSPSAPAAVIAGLIMAITGKYKLQMIAWWGFTAVGFGLVCLFDIETPKWQWAFFQLIAGSGVGALFALTLPPIQAVLPVSEIAHATATFAFSRSFGSVWGIAISTAIFTSTVSPKLAAIPGAAQAGLTGQTALGFATELWLLPEAMRTPVREAYAHALNKSFIFFVPLCGVGLIASFFLKDVPLPDFNDSEHGIRDSMQPPPRAQEPKMPDASPHSTRGYSTQESKGASGAFRRAGAPFVLAPTPASPWGDDSSEMLQAHTLEQSEDSRVRPLLMGIPSSLQDIRDHHGRRQWTPDRSKWPAGSLNSVSHLPQAYEGLHSGHRRCGEVRKASLWSAFSGA